MSCEIDYNFHDFLKLRIVRPRSRGLVDVVNLKLSSFSAANLGEPDIILRIGDFDPRVESCYVVDSKYYIKPNYFFCRESEGSAQWDVEIHGLEYGQTIINFCARMRPCRQSIMNPDLLAHGVLLSVLQYKLCSMGVALIHCAAVERQGRGILLMGRSGSFKTSLCMDFVRKSGFTCLGDDYVLLGGGRIWSFLMHPTLFQFMTNSLPDETRMGFFNEVRYLWQLARGRLKKTNLVGLSSEPHILILLSRAPGAGEASVRFGKIDTFDDVIARSVVNNQLESFAYAMPTFGVRSAPFLRYVSAYSFVLPGSSVASYEARLRKILESHLEGVPVHGVQMPCRYDDKTFQKFCAALADRWADFV